jgi:multicomponent Na+:H+ antiporter subunit G
MITDTSTATFLAAEADGVKEFSEIGWIPAIIAGVLALLGAIYILVPAVAMYLAPDALSQVNMLGPALGMGLPLLIMADLVKSWATEGFILGYLIRAIVAVLSLLVVQAVGSYVMGRALHATLWDHTVPLSGGERAKETN